MAKRKYSVPFEGGVLTRSTDREYTHGFCQVLGSWALFQTPVKNRELAQAVIEYFSKCLSEESVQEIKFYISFVSFCGSGILVFCIYGITHNAAAELFCILIFFIVAGFSIRSTTNK
jgi:hypothetical protein